MLLIQVFLPAGQTRALLNATRIDTLASRCVSGAASIEELELTPKNIHWVEPIYVQDASDAILVLHLHSRPAIPRDVLIKLQTGLAGALHEVLPWLNVKVVIDKPDGERHPAMTFTGKRKPV